MNHEVNETNNFELEIVILYNNTRGTLVSNVKFFVVYKKIQDVFSSSIFLKYK